MSFYLHLKTFLVSWTYCKDRLGHKFKGLEDRTDEEDVSGKVVVITGASSGLGKVLALQMAKRDAHVVLACRNPAKTQVVVDEILEEVPGAKLTIVTLELSDMDSVVACAKEIKGKFPQVNILINNAGYMGNTAYIERTKGNLEKNLATNYLGHALLSLHLLDHLKKAAPSRIVFVASMAFQGASLEIEDLNMETREFLGVLNFGPYSNSKKCVMLFAKELGRRLEGTGVHTFSLCPGVVDTGLFTQLSRFNKTFTRSIVVPLIGCTPEQGAETPMYCSLSTKCAQETGLAYHFGERWVRGNKDMTHADAVALWKATEELLRIDTLPTFGV